MKDRGGETSSEETQQVGDPDELPAIPGTRPVLVFADESGTDGAKYYGFGTLWMKLDRRGDFSDLIKELRERHDYRWEIKWNKVSGRSLSFYKELVERFFKWRELMFHALIVRKGYVRKDMHRDHDEARRKHFVMLLSTKIGDFAKRSRKKRYRLRVDPIASRYRKADEAAFKILNSTLKQEIGHPAVESLLTKDSKTTPGIQVADVLLGAVMSTWNDTCDSAAKLELQSWVAEHLGWPDLKADTFASEAKFNIWSFYADGPRGDREVRTRHVKLKYPMGTLISRGDE